MSFITTLPRTFTYLKLHVVQCLRIWSVVMATA